jgi:cell division septum initiation protein DivIVA
MASKLALAEQVEQTVVVKDTELANLKSEISQLVARKSEIEKGIEKLEQDRDFKLDSADAQAEKIVNDAVVRGKELVAEKTREANRIYDSARDEVDALQSRVEMLQSNEKEFATLSGYQKALGEARSARDRSDSQRVALLKDLKLCARMFEWLSTTDTIYREFDRTVQRTEIDEMFAAVRRLRDLISDKKVTV